MINYSIPAIATSVAASVVIVVLNIFLSTRKNPIFSFILPFLSFILSIVYIIIGLSGLLSEDISYAVASIVRYFFIYNIPTVILILTSMLTRCFYKKMQL